MNRNSILNKLHVVFFEKDISKRIQMYYVIFIFLFLCINFSLWSFVLYKFTYDFVYCFKYFNEHIVKVSDLFIIFMNDKTIINFVNIMMQGFFALVTATFMTVITIFWLIHSLWPFFSKIRNLTGYQTCRFTVAKNDKISYVCFLMAPMALCGILFGFFMLPSFIMVTSLYLIIHDLMKKRAPSVNKIQSIKIKKTSYNINNQLKKIELFISNFKKQILILMYAFFLIFGAFLPNSEWIESNTNIKTNKDYFITNNNLSKDIENDITVIINEVQKTNINNYNKHLHPFIVIDYISAILLKSFYNLSNSFKWFFWCSLTIWFFLIISYGLYFANNKNKITKCVILVFGSFFVYYYNIYLMIFLINICIMTFTYLSFIVLNKIYKILTKIWVSIIVKPVIKHFEKPIEIKNKYASDILKKINKK